MATEWPKYLVRLLVALLQHQARAWLGEEFMEAAGDALAEIGGQELHAVLDRWLRDPQTARQLLEAARRAEEYVQAHCPDPALRGALTLRFADLPAVQAALASLPAALDEAGVERALRDALTRDLGRSLTPAQIDAAVRLYTDALLRAVSTLKDFALPLIAQNVLTLREEHRAQTALLREIRARLEREESPRPEEAAALNRAFIQGELAAEGDISGSVIIIGYGNQVILGPSQVARLRSQVTLPGDLPPGSYLPFPRNPLFTGREEELQRLAEMVLGPHPALTPTPVPPSPLPQSGRGEGGQGEGVRALITQAITGMGGVGKTQLAVEFAYRYGYRFRSVHWLDLRDPALLEEQIAQNGACMGLEPWPDKLPEQVARTRAAWQAEGPRLLILDNLEDTAAAQRVLAYLSHSSLRLLLIARRRDWPRHLGLQILPLDEFTPEESRAFLRHFLPPDRAADADLDALAERLGHLPLALELAGRYLERHPRLGISDYLKSLEQALAHPSMQGWRPDLSSPTGHDLSLWATFALSWERVEDPDARRAFLLAGFCAPNVPIPEAILERMMADPVRRDEALGELVGLGLLKGDPTAPVIHPLLAEFARSLALTPSPLLQSGRGSQEEEGVRARLPHPSRELIQRARELRRQGTPAERILWECLRDRQLGGYKFRRQHPLGRFIADFFCPEARLIIEEVDGAVHREATQQERDQAREELLREHGYYLLRFTNDEILNRTETVLRRILERVQELTLTPTPVPPPPLPPSGRGGGGQGAGVRARLPPFRTALAHL
ncbi:MAG: DUF559 domain-containing protein, partial [Thermoflexales bacterium]|nr:DUF559 domain-containing protein [Thermoflexales bacterium]